MAGEEHGSGAVVGYTEGVFDLFHVGHLDLVTAAVQRCDRLVVGVLDDVLTEAVTGAPPYTPAGERRAVVEAVRGVSAAVVVSDRDLAAVRAGTGFTVLFRHGGPVAGAGTATDAASDAATDSATDGYAVVDLPEPRQTTSAVLRTALAAHLAPTAELSPTAELAPTAELSGAPRGTGGR